MHKSRQAIDNQQKQETNQEIHKEIEMEIVKLQLKVDNLLYYLKNSNDPLIIKNYKKSCDWTYDPEYAKWDTDCGNSFQFTNDGPSENGAKYCQYCGRPINEIKDL